MQKLDNSLQMAPEISLITDHKNYYYYCNYISCLSMTKQ